MEEPYYSGLVVDGPDAGLIRNSPSTSYCAYLFNNASMANFLDKSPSLEFAEFKTVVYNFQRFMVGGRYFRTWSSENDDTKIILQLIDTPPEVISHIEDK